MDHAAPVPTLKDIARQSGLSVSAVSYALRGAPNIPPATVARVRAAAEKLRYRSNPRVGELMAHIRRGHPVARGERIAFLWSDTSWKQRSFPLFFEGVSRRAGELGYGIEEFWLKEPAMTHPRLAKILRSRGISGLILSPLQSGHELNLDWDWTPFAAAILGNAACTPELHRAGHHHFLGMHLIMEKLKEKGYRRVAAILNPAINERAKRAGSAAFLEHHPHRAQARRYLFWEPDAGKTATLSWLKKVRADAIVCTTATARRLCPSGSSLCGGRKVAVLDRLREEATWSGINQGEDILGAQAVDLVAGQLHHNERGAPSHPKMLLFPGPWEE